MKNLAIFTIPKKKMDFFEVTGGFQLDSVLEGPPARRELKKSLSSLDQEGLCKGLLLCQQVMFLCVYMHYIFLATYLWVSSFYYFSTKFPLYFIHGLIYLSFFACFISIFKKRHL
ncbi:MAG: hypothetical protein R6T98_16205 [Desulfatiglandales bacterium]